MAEQTVSTSSFARRNAAYWTGRAEGYSDVNREELDGSQRRVWASWIDGRIRERLGPRARGSLRVLDAGTGPGFFAIILAELGYRVWAVDYTDAMLDQARANEARANGALEPGRIVFRRADVARTGLASGGFDVIVSRNVTWDLPDPAAAYAEWERLLAPGGLLLNFDAAWYRYLYDGGDAARRRRDRDNVRRTGVADDTAGTDVDEMEAIARLTPLSRLERPAWDLDELARLGLDAVADERAWETLWTECERVNNASTPLFMIEARKGGRP